MTKSAKQNGRHRAKTDAPAGITSITVGGFKSIAREQTIEIRPLTILAGANSSGKSSIMQALLLLKQTLEATYDPGTLLLSGPNVKFSALEQFFHHTNRRATEQKLTVGYQGYMPLVGGSARSERLRSEFIKEASGSISVRRTQYSDLAGEYDVYPDTSLEDIRKLSWFEPWLPLLSQSKTDCVISPNRCFLSITLQVATEESPHVSLVTLSSPSCSLLRRIIHVPGLRGLPEREYPVSAVGATFPGKFDHYTASVIAQWKKANPATLDHLSDDLNRLGLTWKVEASAINDAQVELKVARLPHPNRRGASDLVNIADVGFGVSQTLPIAVALLAAQLGQMVYIEQPELHLHPRAQVSMAQLLVDAANRGVRVVAETHSSLLLLGVQSLVAEGQFASKDVILHWFERKDDGTTEIRSAELDEQGRFGDWPEDFDDVSLEAQMRFMNAAEKRQVAR